MYESTDDPYCYPGTTVLKNRRNLRTQEALDRFLSAVAGHPLHLHNIIPADFLVAMIQSFRGDEEPLVEQLSLLL